MRPWARPGCHDSDSCRPGRARIPVEPQESRCRVGSVTLSRTTASPTNYGSRPPPHGDAESASSGIDCLATPRVAESARSPAGIEQLAATSITLPLNALRGRSLLRSLHEKPRRRRAGTAVWRRTSGAPLRLPPEAKRRNRAEKGLGWTAIRGERGQL